LLIFTKGVTLKYLLWPCCDSTDLQQITCSCQSRQSATLARGWWCPRIQISMCFQFCKKIGMWKSQLTSWCKLGFEVQ